MRAAHCPASRLRKLDAHHRRVREELYALLMDTIHSEMPVDQLYKHYILGIRFGISRQRAGDLCNGRLLLFNSETLIAMLQRFGVKVGITVLERRHIRLYDDPGPH